MELGTRWFAMLTLAVVSGQPWAAQGDEILGSWQGRITDSRVKATAIQLDFRRAATGELVGAARYPDRGCVSVLVHEPDGSFAKGSRRTFRERVEQPSADCPSGAKIFATWEPIDQLAFQYILHDPPVRGKSGDLRVNTFLVLTRVGPNPLEHAAAARPLTATNPATATAVEVGKQARLQTAIYSVNRDLLALTGGADPALPAGYDLAKALQRRNRGDRRALALMNYAYNVPRYETMGETLSYARELGAAFNLLAKESQALAIGFEANRARLSSYSELLNDVTDEAFAIAVQNGAGYVFDVELRAATGRDPGAARRFDDVVEKAHSGVLKDLMQMSLAHYDMCSTLLRWLGKLDELRDPEPADYRRAAQYAALIGVLTADDLPSAQRAVADAEMRLRKGLASRQFNQTLDALMRAFGSFAARTGRHSSRPRRSKGKSRCTRERTGGA
jgi:hypothetical protein